MSQGLAFAVALWLCTLAVPAGAVEGFSVPVSAETEVFVRHYPAAGERLLLWFPCDEGQGTAEARAAVQLAARGLETWLPDMLGAHFLPMAPSSMEQLPAAEIAALIQRAVASGKRVYLVTAGRAALPVLRGLALWRGSAGKADVAGVILFYPELYAGTPSPGAEARYEPVVQETRARIVVMQGERSPGRWWLMHLARALEAAGSQVETRLLPGVRGYFFVREEQTPQEAAMAARLPELVQEAVAAIDAMEKGDRP